MKWFILWDSGGTKPFSSPVQPTRAKMKSCSLCSKTSNRRIPGLVMILAPRHLDRLGDVEKILQREAIPWTRRSSLPASLPSPDSGRKPRVILLDTMGELMKLYRLGTVVFIGGSLVPVGGHNPLEPLFFKKCVLFGPHMFNFLEISRLLTEREGAIQVQGKEDLLLQVKRLLDDEGARNKVGEKGYQILQENQGATERIFQEIKPYLHHGPQTNSP